MTSVRRRRRVFVLIALLLVTLLGIAAPASAKSSDPSVENSPENVDARIDETGKIVVVLDIDGPIGPATSRYIVRGLSEAATQGAALVILREDTPGGLDTSMREINRAILSSPVPVATYVAPSGARAASAGTYILYASHLAAMAPGTNLGAATPISIGGLGAPESPSNKPDDKAGSGDKSTPDDKSHPGLEEKVINDAVAYIRGLAQLRKRNVEWAEKAVREAASLSAEEALQQKVIDLIAADLPALLRDVDGRRVDVDGKSVVLETAHARVIEIAPDWTTRLLATITNPTIASILMMIGIYGLIFELYSPGLIAPGVIGGICLLLGLYALHLLPVDFTGVALLLLGIVMMVAEVFVPGFGVLAIGGLVAFVLGSVMLFQGDVPGFSVAWPVIGSVALVLGSCVLAAALLALRARKRPVVAGREQMIGAEGRVLDWREATGRVWISGEIWQARGQATLAPGMSVRVRALDGLTLEVEPETGSGERRDG